MSLPYIGYANATLAQQPAAKPGMLIRCDKCRRRHRLRAADDGSELLLFYHCHGAAYLASVAGRLVTGIEPDVTGSIPCGTEGEP